MNMQMKTLVYGVAFTVMVAMVCGVCSAANVDREVYMIFTDLRKVMFTYAEGGGEHHFWRDTWLNIRTAEGEIIQEKITLTGTEEDIRLGDGETRIIYDYEKGFMTVRLNDEGVERCLVSSFERRSLESPANEQVKQEMTSGDFAELSETDYYVDAASEVDPAILSYNSRAMCEHLPIQWMSDKPDMSAVSVGGRKKRRCRRVCSAYCSCCPRDCGVRCSIECSW